MARLWVLLISLQVLLCIGTSLVSLILPEDPSFQASVEVSITRRFRGPIVSSPIIRESLRLSNRPDCTEIMDSWT